MRSRPVESIELRCLNVGVQLFLGFLCELKNLFIDKSHGSNLGRMHCLGISGESVVLNIDENGGSSTIYTVKTSFACEVFFE